MHQLIISPAGVAPAPPLPHAGEAGGDQGVCGGLEVGGRQTFEERAQN